MKKIILFLFFANSLFSLPHFSLRNLNNCQSCHVNPTGKGMRNQFGVSFAQDELSLQSLKDEINFDEVNPQITNQLSIGFDARTLILSDFKNNKSMFYQMQGDLYFDFKLNKKIRFYFDKGLYDGFETFAIAKILPFKGFVKVGKFIPSFGIKTDDHTTWVRSVSGFGNGAEDEGIELGINPNNFQFTASIFNGNSSTLKKAKAIVLRTEYMGQIGFANYLIGASYYRLPQFEINNKISNYFCGVSLNNNLTAFYETIKNENDFGNGLIHTSASNLIFHYLLISGLDLRFSIENKIEEFNNSDLNYKRYSFGFDFYPVSGFEIRPIYRINKEPITQIDNDEFQIIIHFYY